MMSFSRIKLITVLLGMFVLCITSSVQAEDGLVWQDSCDANNSAGSKTTKKVFVHTKLVTGIKGHAVLIERRLYNPVKDSDFNKLDNWIKIGKPEQLAEGGAFSAPCVVVDKENYVRQVINGLMEKKLYCISLYAHATAEPAVLEILVDDNVVDSFKLTKDYKRYHCSFRAVKSRSALTLKSSEGTAVLDAVQIDERHDYPTSYEAKGKRGFNRGELAVDLVNSKHGSVSLWIKPNWLNSVSDCINSLFGFGDPSPKGNSYVALRVLPDKHHPEHVWKNRLLFMIRGIYQGNKLNASAVSPPLQEWPKKEWYHIVATWQFNKPPKKSDIRLYLDGKEVSSRQFLFPAEIDMKKCNIGYWHGGYANGAIDEIKLYDKVLTASDVEKLYKEVGK